MSMQDVLRRPLITEKSTSQRDDRNIVAFAVDVRANKIEIRKAVEAQFKGVKSPTSPMKSMRAPWMRDTTSW